MTDQTETEQGISPEVLAGAALVGAKDGIIGALADKAEDARSQAAALIEPGDQRHIPHPWENLKNRVLWTVNYLATPGDMNLKHSPHPAETTMQLHAALVNKTADTLTEKGPVEGVRLSSAAATAMVVGAIDPFKKLKMADSVLDAANVAEPHFSKTTITWDDYAHLLGKGIQPPKLKPLRDFSDLMEYTLPRYGDLSSLLVYQPDKMHKISIRLYHDWSKPGDAYEPLELTNTLMSFTVRAQKDKALYGSGAEMFHSGMKRLSQEGVKIHKIQASWSSEGDLATNFNHFYSARQHGAGVKEALNITPTGRWASDAGFTEVGGARFDLELALGKKATKYQPQFTRPIFGNDSAYNDYGNAWASSQGRASQDLISRHQSAEKVVPASKSWPHLAGYSAEQAAAIRQHIHDHIDRHFEALISGMRIEPNAK